jgi:hypothetical protein
MNILFTLYQIKDVALIFPAFTNYFLPWSSNIIPSIILKAKSHLVPFLSYLLYYYIILPEFTEVPLLY